MRKFSSFLVVALLIASCGQKPSPTPKPTPSKSNKPSPAITISPNPDPTRKYIGPSPLNVLILGSDGRNLSQTKCYDKSRADAIHIWSIDPTTMRGTLLNILRDTWTNVPGYGYRKINDAMAYGGPKLMIRTVEKVTGIDIHYYALTNFCSFIDLIDAVGGIKVRVPKNITDRQARFKYGGRCKSTSIKKGLSVLNGCQALIFARSRHEFPRGDFDRTFNQSVIMLAGLAKLKELSFIETAKVVRAFVRFDIPKKDLLMFFSLGRKLKAQNLKNCTVPGRGGYAGKQSVIYLTSSSFALFADIKSDAVVNKSTCV